MFEYILIGIVQGITEWLPISSEGILALLKANFFDSGDTSALFRHILFLHLGTFFAAYIYLHKDVHSLIRAFFQFKNSEDKDQKTLIFLIVSTLISGGLGFVLLESFIFIYETMAFSTQALNIVIAGFLLITAFLQIKIKSQNLRSEKDVNIKDAIILGLVQAFSVLPGLSRSGLTVSFLLLRKFDKAVSLRLSFLMSLPIVLGGNILLNFRIQNFSYNDLIALIFAFIFGLLTIKALFKVAEKINFGYFLIFFSLLILASCFF